jgi:hypothetical protein
MRATYCIYDMIFVNFNWVFTRWQWSVNLFTNRKKNNYVHENKQHTKQYKKTTQNRKQKIQNKKTNIKRKIKV